MPSLHKSRHFLEVISKSHLCFNQVHGRHAVELVEASLQMCLVNMRAAPTKKEWNQIETLLQGWFVLQALYCIKSCETSNTPPYADQLGHCWPVFVPDLSSTRSKSVA